MTVVLRECSAPVAQEAIYMRRKSQLPLSLEWSGLFSVFASLLTWKEPSTAVAHDACENRKERGPKDTMSSLGVNFNI